MSSDIRALYERASTGIIGPDADGDYLKALSLIIPKNSGIQNVWSPISTTKHLAKHFHWKFSKHALALINSREKGVVSISSENGGGLKMINTSRHEQVMTGKNQSLQKADAWDKVFYGNQKFDANE